MTVSDLITYIRQRYNAVSDNYFADSSEMVNHIYNACQQLAAETLCIERTYSTTTVASTAEYAFPTYLLGTKRVTYDSSKLQKITQRELDILTINQGATTSGTPLYYYEWARAITLYPVPDSAETLLVYGYAEPQALTTTSTLEVPTRMHLRLADFVVAQMYAKDGNFAGYDRLMAVWSKSVADEKRYQKQLKRGDGPVFVQDVALISDSILGPI